MCRWLAYTGDPVYLEDLIFRPDRSLIDQSLHAAYSETTTNGDGFGVGWYGLREGPGVYRSVRPAWNDWNLIDLAAQIESPLFLAHVRSATGTEVQRSNCHPFRHERWLFMHNGSIDQFQRLRRALTFAVDPELYPAIYGTTDSEVMFFLALTFGLDAEPVPALERMAGFVEATGRSHGVEHALHMTLGLSDGERIYAVRYSSSDRAQSLFHSRTEAAMRELKPGLKDRSVDRTTVVVSEPLDDMGDDWAEIPQGSVVTVLRGEVDVRTFTPRPPE